MGARYERWKGKINIVISALIAIGLVFPLPAAAGDKMSASDFEVLKKRLVKDGFKSEFIQKVYAAPGVAFETKGVALFFVHRESTLNYDQFLSPKDLRMAKKYIHTHKDAFQAAEKAYGVDPEVITAILLVETRLGTYMGGRSILNTLSTMAALDDPAVRAKFWKQVIKLKNESKVLIAVF